VTPTAAADAAVTTPAPDHSASTSIIAGGLLVAAGGILLGLQVDQNGAISGTGWVSFAIGALLALGATIARTRGSEARIPRNTLGLFAVVVSFLGLSFLLSGVLAPGGPWMFVELFVLVAVVVLGRPRPDAARWVGFGVLAMLVLMLIFRLWVTYQGSENRWAVTTLAIPVISWIPIPFLDPIKTISLGSFTPHELGLPPAGLSFGPTVALWSIGFALCVAGLVLVQTGAREHENDRIHALIQTLPPALARFVERLVPEEEWLALGLHGLPERRLARRIESIVAERMSKQKEIQSAIDAGRLLAQSSDDGFANGIQRAITDPESGRPRA
jgi:hypothetical protein